MTHLSQYPSGSFCELPDDLTSPPPDQIAMANAFERELDRLIAERLQHRMTAPDRDGLSPAQGIDGPDLTTA